MSFLLSRIASRDKLVMILFLSQGDQLQRVSGQRTWSKLLDGS